MKIPNQLSQFKDKNALIIVTGKQDAALYHLHDDVLDNLVSFVTPRPKYSDNEGIFQAAVHGRVQSGSVDMYEDEDMIRDFLHEFKDKTKNIKNDFDEVYFFAPSTCAGKIKRTLPKKWQEKITHVEQGNYFNETPLNLLERLAKEHEQPFSAQTKEEQKILSVPPQ